MLLGTLHYRGTFSLTQDYIDKDVGFENETLPPNILRDNVRVELENFIVQEDDGDGNNFAADLFIVCKGALQRPVFKVSTVFTNGIGSNVNTNVTIRKGMEHRSASGNSVAWSINPFVLGVFNMEGETNDLVISFGATSPSGSDIVGRFIAFTLNFYLNEEE